MKSFSFNKPIGKHHHVEACGFIDTSSYPCYQLGYHMLYHEGHFSCKWAIGILSLSFDFNWKGDHPGFYLMIDTPWLELLDFEFYDTRHEEQIEKDQLAEITKFENRSKKSSLMIAGVHLCPCCMKSVSNTSETYKCKKCFDESGTDEIR